MTDWDPEILYHQISHELLFDPLPPAEVAAAVSDDHQVTPVDPGWFTSFDDVDSRTVRSVGAPE